MPGVVKVAIVLNKEGNQLYLIKQWDELGTELQMKFKSIRIVEDINQRLFRLKRPKNSEFLSI